MLWSETTLLWLWEQKFQGTKVPSMKLSFPGAKVHGNENSIIRCGHVHHVLTDYKTDFRIYYVIHPYFKSNFCF